MTPACYTCPFPSTGRYAVGAGTADFDPDEHPAVVDLCTGCAEHAAVLGVSLTLRPAAGPVACLDDRHDTHGYCRCQWRPGCGAPAVATLTHETLGAVPACQPCLAAHLAPRPAGACQCADRIDPACPKAEEHRELSALISEEERVETALRYGGPCTCGTGRCHRTGHRPTAGR